MTFKLGKERDYFTVHKIKRCSCVVNSSCVVDNFMIDILIVFLLLVFDNLRTECLCFRRINYWRVKKKSQTKLALNTLLTWILINANEKKSILHLQFLALSNKAQNNLLFTPFSLLSLGVRRDRGVTLDTIHTWVLKMVK